MAISLDDLMADLEINRAVVGTLLVQVPFALPLLLALALAFAARPTRAHSRADALLPPLPQLELSLTKSYLHIVSTMHNECTIGFHRTAPAELAKQVRARAVGGREASLTPSRSLPGGSGQVHSVAERSRQR